MTARVAKRGAPEVVGEEGADVGGAEYVRVTHNGDDVVMYKVAEQGVDVAGERESRHG